MPKEGGNSVTIQWVLGVLISVATGVSGYSIHLTAKVADEARAATEKKVDKEVFKEHDERLNKALDELKARQEKLQDYLIEKLGPSRSRDKNHAPRSPSR